MPTSFPPRPSSEFAGPLRPIDVDRRSLAASAIGPIALVEPEGVWLPHEQADHLDLAPVPCGRIGGDAGRVDAGDPVATLQLVQGRAGGRSEEHTSELQSLMRISYAVFCLTK